MSWPMLCHYAFKHVFEQTFLCSASSAVNVAGWLLLDHETMIIASVTSVQGC